MRINVKMMECYVAGGIQGGWRWVEKKKIERSEVIAFPVFIRNSLQTEKILQPDFIKTTK